jgi:hypothetical protein
MNKDENAAAIIWMMLNNKLHSLLSMDKVRTREQNLQLCKELETMSYDERIGFIEQHYGKNYLNKSVPILAQMNSIEQALHVKPD